MSVAIARARLDTQSPGATQTELHPELSRAHVRFIGVGKTYDGRQGPVDALSGIDLAIQRGEIFGIIGRSGAGKSSLIRTINRLEQPTRGRVLIDQVDIGGFDENTLVTLRRQIGMIFQHFNLMSAKTVWQNVELPLQDALPESVQARISAQPESAQSSVILRLRLTGQQAQEPDLGALFAALGGQVRLLQGGVEQIQGHALGQLLLSVSGMSVGAEELRKRAQHWAQHVEVVGYGI